MSPAIRRFFSFPMWLMFCAIASAQPEETTGSAKPPTMKEIAPGIVEIEGIRVDSTNRTVTVQAEVALTEGVLEYALVNVEGKVHESLLSTKAEPFHLHTAMLLLGARDAKDSIADAPPGQITAEFLKTAPPIVGDPLEILIRWVDPAGKTVEQPLSSLIEDELHKKEMPADGWIYNGSVLSQGKFLAQLSLSIISLVSDSSALANQNSPGHNEQDAWGVNKKAVPPEGTHVELIFHLLPQKTSDQ